MSTSGCSAADRTDVTALTYASNETSVPESTLTSLFFEAIDRFGTEPAFQRFESADRIVDISYDEAYALVRSVAAGMASSGLSRGDRAAILSENRPEWAIADYACLCSGVIGVPIYPTLSPPQIAYILRDSGAKLVFVSSEELLEKAREAVRECPQAVQIVAFDVPSGGDVTSWVDFLASGRGRRARCVPRRGARCPAGRCRDGALHVGDDR